MRRTKNKTSRRIIEVLKDLINADDKEKLETLIELEPSLVSCQFMTQDSGNVCCWTPLCWAVENGSLIAIQILIEKGADLYSTCSRMLGFQRSSFTPYSLACSVSNRLEALEKLLELGIVVDQPIPSPEVTEEEGGSLSYAGYATGLHYAVCTCNFPLSRLLLQHGASVQMTDNHGNTALHLACENPHVEIIKLVAFYGGIDNSTNADCLSPVGLLWQSLPVKDKAVVAMVIQYLVAAGYNLRTDTWYTRNSTRACDVDCRCMSDQQTWDREGAACGCLRCFLQPILSEPHPLKVICRSLIRRYLFSEDSASCHSALMNLPLPPLLRSFIMLEDSFW